MRWRCLVLLGVLVGCNEPSDGLLQVTYDPCAPLSVTAASDTSSQELASIDSAIGMWRAVGLTGLTRENAPGAPEVSIAFQEAPSSFHGLYEDEVGRVLVNRRLVDDHARAVTVAHELGHAFGLFHVASAERASVMNRANLKLAPTTEDAATVFALWPDCRPD